MTAPVAFSRAGMARGAWLCLPLLIGTTPFALVCGIVAQMHGLSVSEATLMSAAVYGGSSQLVALASWAHPAPVLGAAFAAFAVNLRFALMGPVLAPWLDRLRGWRLWGSLFVMADQNWAVAVKEMQAGGRDAGVLFGNGLLMYLAWVATTALGYLLADAIRPAPDHPLFFAALAVFVAMLASLWRGRGDLLPWAVAAVTALAVWRLQPHGSWYIIAGALAGSLAGGWRDLRRGRAA